MSQLHEAPGVRPDPLVRDKEATLKNAKIGFLDEGVTLVHTLCTKGAA